MRIADLMANLSLSTGDFSRGLHRAVSEAKSASRQIADAFSGAPVASVDKLGNSLEQASKKAKSGFRDVKRIVQGIMISQAFYRTANAVQGAVSSLAQYNRELEQTNIAFKYLVGNQDKADRYVKAMQQLAATTPFTTESAAKSSRMLLSMGFAANQVLPVLRILSDASAVSGADPETFKRIVYAFGQIRTSGKLMRQDLMQLASAGLPVFQILREELGLTQDQLNDLGKLNISSGTAISAILRGLQKRYKGASQEIAETTQGMLSTIKDNLYITGSMITKGIADKSKGVVRKVRDTLNEVRQILEQAGLGGLVNKMFPPEMQIPIRLFAGYLGALCKSIGQLLKAISPLSRELFHAFVLTFNAAAPVIISFLNVLTKLISIATQNTTAVRTLAISLTWLTISVKIASMVSRLTAAIKSLGIASFVAKAVVRLAKSVKIFYVALTSHPIVAVITIIAAALLSLALSSKTTTEWLDRMTASLGRLFGFDAEEMWKPLDPSEATDDLQEFYDGLNDIGKGAEDVGKKGEKAGKKIKDKFLASFDEVHTIPDKLKEANITGGGGLDDIKLPKMKKFDPGDKKQQKLPPFKWPKIPPFIWPKIPPFPGWPEIPPIPLPNIPLWLAVVLKALKGAWRKIRELLKDPWPEIPPLKVPDIQWGKGWRTIKDKIKSVGQDVINGLEERLEQVRNVCADIADALEEGFGSVPDVLGSAVAAALGMGGALAAGLSGIPDVIGACLEGACGSIDGFREKLEGAEEWLREHAGGLREGIGIELGLITTTVLAHFGLLGPALATLLVTAGISIKGFTKETGTEVKGWSGETSGDVLTWKEKVVAAVLACVGATSPAITTWVVKHGGAIKNWAVSSAGAVASGAKSMIASIGNWIGSTASGIANWVGSTAGSIAGWASGVAGSVKDWAVGTGGQVKDWAKGTGGQVKDWATETGGKVKDWCLEHKKGIGIATGVTATLLAAWATGGLSTVGEFVAGAGPAIAEWGAGAGASIATFASGAADKIAGWIGQSGPGIQNFAATSAGHIEAGKVAGLGSIAGFVAVAGPKIKKWVGGSLGDLKNWKDNSVAKLKESCSGMGTHISNFKSSAQQKFAQTWANVKANCNSAWSNMTSSFGGTTSKMQSLASNMKSRLGSIFGGLAGITKQAFSGVGRAIGAVMRPVIRGMNTLIRGLNKFRIDVPNWVPGIGGKNFGFSIPQLPVPGFANGGIIQKEGLIRAGEKGKREMIVPLENPAAMQPFADAIASRIQPSGPQRQDDGPPQILYVGTLIADERSLTELERKMKVIRMKERRR